MSFKEFRHMTYSMPRAEFRQRFKTVYPLFCGTIRVYDLKEFDEFILRGVEAIYGAANWMSFLKFITALNLEWGK